MSSANQTTMKARGLLDIAEDERQSALSSADRLFAVYQADPTETNRNAWVKADQKYQEICSLYVEGRRLKRDFVLQNQGAYQ